MGRLSQRRNSSDCGVTFVTYFPEKVPEDDSKQRRKHCFGPRVKEFGFMPIDLLGEEST